MATAKATIVLADTALGNRLETVMSYEVTGRGRVPVVEFVQDTEAPAFYINSQSLP